MAAIVLLAVVKVTRNGAQKMLRTRIVMALLLAATCVAGCDFGLGREPAFFAAPTPEHVISVKIDPDEDRVGDVIYTMPPNPDGSCPTFAVAMEIKGSAVATSEPLASVNTSVNGECELVIDEIQRR